MPPHSPHPASHVSLCLSGFSGHRSLRTVLLDWIEFFGSRPGEILYIDGGSNLRTRFTLADLHEERLIDRLELIHPSHWENSFHRCYIQEYRAGLHATLPYVCFIKPDTLPYRTPGTHIDWLAHDLKALDQHGVFAITNTHLLEPPISREGDYLVSDFASLNFALLKRETWHASLQEQIRDFIASNFQGDYPERILPEPYREPKYRRALIEWAWQAHCKRHALRTLARVESRDWTIFHVNKLDAKLLALRDRYRRREDLEPFLNLPKGYYRPKPRGLSHLGRTIENSIRRLKGKQPPSPAN